MDLGLSSFGSLLNCSSGCSLQVLATLRAFRYHPAAFWLYNFNQQILFYTGVEVITNCDKRTWSHNLWQQVCGLKDDHPLHTKSRLGNLQRRDCFGHLVIVCNWGVFYWPRNDEPRL